MLFRSSKDEARKRVVALQGRLEAELADQMRIAGRNLLLSFLACIAMGLLYYFVLSKDNPDSREL